jgi:hypothetical protein
MVRTWALPSFQGSYGLSQFMKNFTFTLAWVSKHTVLVEKEEEELMKNLLAVFSIFLCISLNSEYYFHFNLTLM